MDSLIAYILGSVSGMTLVVIVGGVVLLLNPEKAEKWSALLWRLLSNLGYLFRGAHKQYVKHDLQGRINDFARSLSKDAPYLAGTRVRVDWADGDTTRKSFLEEGSVILRLRRQDPEERNFVHGAYLFVSASLLAKAKRYLSPSQRKALDLFVTTKLIEREKVTVRGIFLDEYLFPTVGQEGSKVDGYYGALTKIDEGSLFYPVLLQELDFLGDKVFGQRRDDKIISEVDSLIEFLNPIAQRRIGEGTDLRLERDYCRCAIVIVGKPAKVTEAGATPYLEYVRNQLVPKDIETIYVLARQENKDVVDAIGSDLSDTFETVRTSRSKVVLRYDDRRIERDQYVLVLRKRGVAIYQAAS